MAEEAAEKNSAVNQFHRWHTCGLCKQRYHGVVACALGWACWKTYLSNAPSVKGNDEATESWYEYQRGNAMQFLGSGLSTASRHREALVVHKAHLAHTSKFAHLGDTWHDIVSSKSNIAACLSELGMYDAALTTFRECYALQVQDEGPDTHTSLSIALNLCSVLSQQGHDDESEQFSDEQRAVARRALGAEHTLTFQLNAVYAQSLWMRDHPTPKHLCGAIAVLEKIIRTSSRVLGNQNPVTAKFEYDLGVARDTLGELRERGSPGPPT